MAFLEALLAKISHELCVNVFNCIQFFYVEQGHMELQISTMFTKGQASRHHFRSTLSPQLEKLSFVFTWREDLLLAGKPAYVYNSIFGRAVGVNVNSPSSGETRINHQAIRFAVRYDVSKNSFNAVLVKAGMLPI